MAKVKYKDLSPELKKLADPTTHNISRSSIGMEQDVGEFYYIPLEKLIPYHKQVRVVFNEQEIDSLAKTIKEHGVRQPLTIIASESKAGIYEIVGGERRYRAAKSVGLEKVPCIIIKDREKAEEIALIENIQRSNLHPIELGRAFKSLLPTVGEGSQRLLAGKLGISHSLISEAISVSELPESIVDKLLKENIKSREIIRALLKCNSLQKMQKLLGVSLSDELQPEKQSTSILRILLSNGIYKIQKKSLEKLNEEQKMDLKKHLIEIIDTL